MHVEVDDMLSPCPMFGIVSKIQHRLPCYEHR